MAKEDELEFFLNNVHHSMDLLIHPLRSMLGSLRAWGSRLKNDPQELTEVQELEQKLQAILAIIMEIAEKGPSSPIEP